MSAHEFTDDPSYFERFWPFDPGVTDDDCAECDRAIARFLLRLEVDLRHASVDLWVAGWTPHDLVAEVRTVTGWRDASLLMAELIVADDSYRSEQARPPQWRTEVEELRSGTGIGDVRTGWLAEWLAERPSARQASACLKAVADELMVMVRPVEA